MNRALSAAVERWPIRGAFAISRETKTEAAVVVAEIEADGAVGRGECVPYGRYGESLDLVLAQIETVRARIESGLDRAALQTALPPGAARNALDCALWDLEAKQAGRRAWELADQAVVPLTTAYTLSLDTPEAMREAARAAEKPLLKLKLGGEGDLARVAAVREGAPEADLIVDANEAWSEADYRRLVPALADLGVSLIEQPFPAGADDALAHLPRPVAVCADESAHDRKTLAALIGKYDRINLKLDKTGGLTEALALREEARAAGLSVMVGCMVGTSLAMAPALILAQGAETVDLDGPLLLAADREPGLRYEGATVHPPAPELWG